MPVQRASPVPRDSANAGWWRSGNGVARDLEIVLNFLRVKGASTKPLVARETGFSRAVVAQRLADLQSSGLVIESGRDPSSGGRPPQKIQFNADRGHVLVADLGATSIDVAVADLDGRIHAHTSEEADISAGPEIILGHLEQLFEKLGATSAEARGVPWGIGVGLPGPVEFNTGRPVAPPIMPGWDAYPVRERLSDRFGVPVWVDNDVNVMALGERAEGSARGIDDFIFIKIGTGIGAGIISHGTIQRGVQGSAGDVGHIQVVFDPEIVCRCGNVGCLEAVAGGAALGRSALKAAEQGFSIALAEMLAQRGSLSARDVAEAARHGDPVSVQLLQQAGRHIGQMLAIAVNMMNPSLIVIGGGVAAAGDVLMASIREVVYGRSLPLATRQLHIRQSTLGDRAGVIGVASMVIDELFAPQRVTSWIEDGSPVGRLELAFY
jgi:glucokinase-like ROK family protein